MIEQVKQKLREKQYRDEIIKKRRQVDKDIEVKKREVNNVSHEDKQIILVMINELEKLCQLTEKYNDEINHLYTNDIGMDKHQLNTEINTLNNKLDKVNYQAWEQKKAIRHKLNKYKEFTVKYPKLYGYKQYDIYTYQYYKVDRFINESESKINKLKTYGELVMEEYNSVFSIEPSFLR
ncbi:MULTISPECIES: hypothetical protein [Staphylococcus]|uniref:hypothetical protein n=1 Tax=Staphylococcus TaxID=1279 RepID=UPI0028864980|nr:hypothetical protein [Staphylococcus chromogenes]MDT0655115.1 hypothetical protein [Staphylococcus chromogenes]MDT0699032.1 hypothetical protein [Staphylococcus chromogenes]